MLAPTSSNRLRYISGYDEFQTFNFQQLISRQVFQQIQTLIVKTRRPVSVSSRNGWVGWWGWCILYIIIIAYRMYRMAGRCGTHIYDIITYELVVIHRINCRSRTLWCASRSNLGHKVRRRDEGFETRSTEVTTVNIIVIVIIIIIITIIIVIFTRF